MATFPITKQPIETVRDLIVALRKISNNNALIYLDCGNDCKYIGKVEVTEMLAPAASMVHLVGSKIRNIENTGRT